MRQSLDAGNLIWRCRLCVVLSQGDSRTTHERLPPHDTCSANPWMWVEAPAQDVCGPSNRTKDFQGRFLHQQDADSLETEKGDKKEGAFYVWERSEIEDVLEGADSPQARLFMDTYHVLEGGNATLSKRRWLFRQLCSHCRLGGDVRLPGTEIGKRG